MKSLGITSETNQGRDLGCSTIVVASPAESRYPAKIKSTKSSKPALSRTMSTRRSSNGLAFLAEFNISKARGRSLIRMFSSAALRALAPWSFWISSYVREVKRERSVAFPQRHISHISMKSNFSSSLICSGALPWAPSPLSICLISSLYFAANSRTAVRDDLNVDIFCRANTS